MDNMEEKLGSILGNPEMMQQIMAMAQNLGVSSPQQPPPPQEQPEPTLPNIDLGTIQKLTSIMGSTNIDREQRALLSALAPYLSAERIRKLENAMRASRLAGFAAQALRQQGSHSSPGR